MLSRCGKLCCPYCMVNLKSFNLVHGRKPYIFYCHRQFLPSDHPLRRQKNNFRKRVDHDPPIDGLSSEESLKEIDGLSNLTFGTKCPLQKPSGYRSTHHWTKKKFFLGVAVLAYKFDPP